MERKKLASRLTDFCLASGIFNTTCGSKEIKQRITEQLDLDDVKFIEGLMGLINDKAKSLSDIDMAKLNELLAELEKIRAELEYKAPEQSGEIC
jgi:hypothetical protein